jgi:hypothetical protein
MLQRNLLLQGRYKGFEYRERRDWARSEPSEVRRTVYKEYWPFERLLFRE